jgi:hypothetical protein
LTSPKTRSREEPHVQPRQGLPVAAKKPAEISAMLPGEVAKWAAVVKTANVTVD